MESFENRSEKCTFGCMRSGSEKNFHLQPWRIFKLNDYKKNTGDFSPVFSSK